MGIVASTGGLASEDLAFEFHLAGGDTRIGVVAYGEFTLSPPTLAGDYNKNGTVDAADYTIRKDAFGSTTELAADGNNNGVIDAADYTVWKDDFGNSATNVSVSTVPEPCALSLSLMAAGMLLGSTRRQRC